MADKFDMGERFCCLSWASRSARDGPDSLKKTLAGPGYAPIDTKTAREATLKLIGNEKTDWDVVFRTINSCFDDLVAAQRAATYPERRKAIRAYHNDLMAQANARGDSKSDGKAAYSEQIGLAFVFTEFLNDSTIAEDRVAMDFELVKLAFALAQYQADHGGYPVRLSQLTPAYIARIPRDIFNDADLHYARDGNGYLLYSVGINGEDDGGRTTEESFAAGTPRGWDDLVVRMPARQAP